jgi:uncharacterized membrane protein YdjX (TVP38/TMEM64 family)
VHPGGSGRIDAKKAALLLAIAVGAGAFFYFDLGEYLTLENLKANRAQLDQMRAAHAFGFAAVFVLLYILLTALSLPGAAILSLASGAALGVLQGTLYVVSGATAWPVLAFLVTRTLLREWVVKNCARRMEGIDRIFYQRGAHR